MSRRSFLLGAVSLAAFGACSSNGGSSASTTSAVVRNTVPLDADPFTLGIASGDPRPTSVILWTRVAPDPLAPDGRGGMPADPVDVRWDIATDEAFDDIVGSGVATAEPRFGHSVHVEADDLDPASDYFYRFTVGEHTSPVGRTRTLPASDSSPERVRLAIANCQYFEGGLYAAYRHIAEDEIDLVVHLGDYIYELPALGGARRSLPEQSPRTLDEFRLRYSSYKVDPDLQAAHAALPFSLVWDDHEVADNYMGDTMPNQAPVDEVRELRAAAYQAWWENLPVRVPAPDGPDAVIYQDLQFGDLARLYLLDARQYAEVPPCRGETDPYDVGTCAAVPEDRDRLGAEQEAWLEDTARQGGVTWDLLGTPVALAGIDAGQGDESVLFLDLWDGYPTARQRVIDLLAELDNPVVLSGDYHQGMVLDVHQTPFDTDSPIVAPEFLSPAISSVPFNDPVAERTPHLREQLDVHGYLVVEATPDALTAEFRVLDDVARPDASVSTASAWLVEPGDPRTRRV